MFVLDKCGYSWRDWDKVVTRDFDVLDEPKAMTEFLEMTCAELERKLPRGSHLLHAPSNSAADRRLSWGSSVCVIVPIDEKCEALAVKWSVSRQRG